LRKFGFLLLIAFLRLLSILPYSWVARLGDRLGALLFLIPSRRKHIVQVNLALCFPGKTDAQYHTMGSQHFRQVVRSYLERGIQWYGNADKILAHVEIDSRIDLDDKDAPPTIFMGFHFVAIEVGCLAYSARLPIASLYSRMSSSAMCEVAKRQRGRFGAEMIERSTSARKIVSVLRSGKPVMLAADLDHGTGNSVFVPFFGIDACTLTSISRLAKLGGARVVPFVTEVLPNFKGYKLTIHEPLLDFPTNDNAVDARRMNAFLESEVMRFPEQYYWVHRRFKHRPAGMAGVY